MFVLLTKVTEQEHEQTILILELAARREDFTVSDFVLQQREGYCQISHC